MLLDHKEGQILSLLFYPARKDIGAGIAQKGPLKFKPVPYLTHHTVNILLTLDGVQSNLEETDCTELAEDSFIVKVK